MNTYNIAYNGVTVLERIPEYAPEETYRDGEGVFVYEWEYDVEGY